MLEALRLWGWKTQEHRGLAGLLLLPLQSTERPALGASGWGGEGSLSPNCGAES